MDHAKPSKPALGEVRVSIDWKALARRASQLARERGEGEVARLIDEAAEGKTDPASLAVLLCVAFRRRPG